MIYYAGITRFSMKKGGECRQEALEWVINKYPNRKVYYTAQGGALGYFYVEEHKMEDQCTCVVSAESS